MPTQEEIIAAILSKAVPGENKIEDSEIDKNLEFISKIPDVDDRWGAFVKYAKEGEEKIANIDQIIEKAKGYDLFPGYSLQMGENNEWGYYTPMVRGELADDRGKQIPLIFYGDESYDVPESVEEMQEKARAIKEDESLALQYGKKVDMSQLPYTQKRMLQGRINY